MGHGTTATWRGIPRQRHPQKKRMRTFTSFSFGEPYAELLEPFAMHVAGRKEAAHDTCCVKYGETLYVFCCGADHTLRVLLRRAGDGLWTADMQTKRLSAAIQIDERHYISVISGVEVAHERVWMLCDRYDETRRRARLVNTYTLIVFFCGWKNVIVGKACRRCRH